jgi:Fe-Mn family superoxide dismutase
MMDKLDFTELKKMVHESVRDSLEKSGKFPVKKKTEKLTIKEATHTTPDSFVLKTEKLSKASKEAHENLYKKYVDIANKISAELDSTNRQEAGSFASSYRSFKMDENYNLNAVKLHELYFANISDLSSEIGVDTIPYMKFSRDFGTFENWQFDFMACAMSSREGWAITVYEPFSNKYMNVCVDGHNQGMPLASIPVLVLDMWSHAYYKDYDVDKRSYLIAMMREINWDVVEARMALAEKCDLSALYEIKPTYNGEPEKMLGAAELATQPPINKVSSANGQTTTSLPPTTPAAPQSLRESKK